MIFWNDSAATEGCHSFKRSLDFLARESGLGRDTIIEILNEPFCRWFIQRQTGQHHYDQARKHVVRQQNLYTVRMDDPLVPVDAEHLARFLSDQPVGARRPIERALERINWALEQPRGDLRAPDVRAPLRRSSPFMAEQPLEILDVMKTVEPALKKIKANDERWIELAAACEQLADRIVAPKDVIGDYYYFRKNWVKELGRGPAWALILLRDRCYDRPGDKLRDTCWLPDTDWLAQRIGVDTATISDWLSSGMKGFTRIEEQKKGWDKSDPQRVGYTLWVALRDPLTLEDQSAYQARLATRLQQEGDGEIPTIDRRVMVKSQLSRPEGDGEIPTIDRGGDGEIPTVESPYIDSPINNRESYRSVAKDTINIILEKSFDDGDLRLLLKFLGIQNPARNKILKLGPTAQEIWGWALYAAQQPRVEDLRGFLVAKLLDNEERQAMPAPFDQLANLSPAQWTEFALAARRQSAGDDQSWELPDEPKLLDTFGKWVSIYREIEFADLPFGLGEIAARLWESERKERDNGQTHLGNGRTRAGKWRADYG